MSSTPSRFDQINARFRGVIDAAVDGIVLIDENGVIETFNPAAERIFGYQAQEVIGRNVSTLMPEPDSSRHDGYIKRYLAGGSPRIIGIGREVVGRRRNGQLFPMELAVGELHDLEPRHFVGMVRDISQRRAMEQALAAREQELRLMFDGAPIGMFTAGLDGSFNEVNPALVRMLGYSAPDLLQMRCLDLTLEADRGALERAYRGLVSGMRSSFNRQLRWLRSDGEVVSVELHAAVAGGSMSAGFIIGQVIDHSERVRSELESREARERLAHVGRVTTLGEMASAIAHEINQPLTAISSYAQACIRLMNQGSADQQLLLETLQAIAAQALRAGDVVRRIRGFVGHRDSDRESVALNDVIASVLELAAIDAAANQAQISTELAPDLPAVLVDPVQIQQVCLNLIRNAIDEMMDLPEPSRLLHIETRLGEEGVEAVFTDVGPGVAAAMRERLFQPFQTTKVEGMGMGLSISHSIISAHGGSLRYSDAPQGGARFTITLPVALSSV
ncbi:MAG: PAS domain S-box protein [Gammaproteobacteria bacterium]|nr:PAS domain S-box protein [Gammaproteobacteria bacterium]